MERIRLQEFLNRKGYTQQELADLIGVKRELVGAWNTGRSDLTRENMAKLLVAGMYLEEIFGEGTVSKITRRADEDRKKDSDPMAVVIAGLERMISVIKENATE